MNPEQPLSRRTFIRTAGGLIIGFSLSDSLALTAAAQNSPAPVGPRPIGPPLGR